MLPIPAMANHDDLARWQKLWDEGAHGALLNEIGQAMKAGELPPEGYGLGALACIALERFDEAVKAGLNGVNRAPREPWLYGALAEAYRGLAKSGGSSAPQDWAKAIAAADQAVRLAPSEPAWHATAARLRRESGFAEEALQSAQRGLERHPQSAHLLVERALATVSMDAGALADLAQAQRVAPADPWPFEAEGQLHLDANRYPAAAVAFRRALRRGPSGPSRERIEDQLVRALAPRPRLYNMLRLLLLTARVTVIGWVVILFGYYILFRLLEIGWKLVPAFKLYTEGFLLLTAMWGALLFVAGHLTRLLLPHGKH